MGAIDNITVSAKVKAMAMTVLRNMENCHAAVLKDWQENMDFIWLDESLTNAVIKEFGADARIVFAILKSTGDLLEASSNGSTTDKALLVKEHTVNDDGTITLKG